LPSLRSSKIEDSSHQLCFPFDQFGIDIPYEKIQIFQNAVEDHIKARPREWIGMSGFRAFGISVDLGYIEYKIVCQVRIGGFCFF